MFAAAAVLAFAIALILHLIHQDPGLMLTFLLAGALLVAVHLAWPLAPWRRPA